MKIDVVSTQGDNHNRVIAPQEDVTGLPTLILGYDPDGKHYLSIDENIDFNVNLVQDDHASNVYGTNENMDNDSDDHVDASSSENENIDGGVGGNEQVDDCLGANENLDDQIDRENDIYIPTGNIIPPSNVVSAKEIKKLWWLIRTAT